MVDLCVFEYMCKYTYYQRLLNLTELHGKSVGTAYIFLTLTPKKSLYVILKLITINNLSILFKLS